MSKCYRKPLPFQENEQSNTQHWSYASFPWELLRSQQKRYRFSSYDQSLETCYLGTTLLIFSEDCSDFLLFQPTAIWMNAGQFPASSSCLLPLCVFAVLGTKPRTSQRTSKCPATELHPQPCYSLLERVLHYHKSTVCLIIPRRVKTDITNACLCCYKGFLLLKDSTRTCHGNSISFSSATELGIIKISDICKLHYNLILLLLFHATKTFGKMC